MLLYSTVGSPRCFPFLREMFTVNSCLILLLSTKGRRDEWTQCCSVLNKVVAFFFFLFLSGSLSLTDDTTYKKSNFCSLAPKKKGSQADRFRS